MAIGIGTVIVEDYKGQRASVRTMVDGDLDDVKDVADFISTHSDAKVISYAFSVSAQYEGDSVDNGKYDRVVQKITALFSDTNETDPTKRKVRFSIPAPRDEDVNDDQELNSDVAEDLKDLLNAVRGADLEYRGGYLTSKKPVSVASVTTGI